MKTKLSIIIMTFITALFLSACGGDGDDAHFKNEESKILIVDCNTSNAVGDYTTMLSGDVLLNEISNTSVTTYHDINGIKKVCTVSGIAYLIRK